MISPFGLFSNTFFFFLHFIYFLEKERESVRTRTVGGAAEGEGETGAPLTGEAGSQGT